MKAGRGNPVGPSVGPESRQKKQRQSPLPRLGVPQEHQAIKTENTFQRPNSDLCRFCDWKCGLCETLWVPLSWFCALCSPDILKQSSFYNPSLPSSVDFPGFSLCFSVVLYLWVFCLYITTSDFEFECLCVFVVCVWLCVCIYTFLMLFLSFSFFFFSFLVCSFYSLFVFFICLFAFLGEEEGIELMCGEVRRILKEMGEEKKWSKNIIWK